jgi:hypothetical protein
MLTARSALLVDRRRRNAMTASPWPAAMAVTAGGSFSGCIVYIWPSAAFG